MNLSALGYDNYFAEQMSELPPHLVPARIVGQHRREWDVLSATTSARAVLAGKRWDPEGSTETADVQPTVGDWVALQESLDHAPPVIVHVLKRRTSLSRNSVRGGLKRQTLVANIDVVAVVAAESPEGSQDAVARRSLSPRRIERYLAAVESGGARPIVVINKSDLAQDPEASAAELRERLSGCLVVPVSCVKEGGLAALEREMKSGQTWGFVGLSGVGKSSIVNRFLGSQVQKVGAERTQDARGRHTTTHRELFQTDSGILLIDTPGMREFALAGADNADLDAFTDIAEFASDCQFGDCRHLSEPGCAVRSAVARGRVSLDRVRSFQALSAELRSQEKAKQGYRGKKKRQKTHKRSQRDFED